MRRSAAGTSPLVRLHHRPGCITLHLGSGIQDANTINLSSEDRSYPSRNRVIFESKPVQVRCLFLAASTRLTNDESNGNSYHQTDKSEEF